MTTHPCCTPSKANLQQLTASEETSRWRRRARAGSLENMVRVDGGPFLMGSESTDAIAADGEGPVRKVIVDPFYISRWPVTNAMFAEFVAKTGAVTEAEREGWSFVFRNRMADDGPGGPCAPGTPWWLKVNGATWHSPEGAPSSVRSRADHPVVHVSWNDVQAYCEWARVRLPTEAEWELAARGGLEQKTYPWGDELTRDGGHMCNIWQGRFPEHDLGEDGFTGTAPADSFQPNGFGLFTMVGNTWEWCEDYFSADGHEARTTVNPVGPASGTSRVIRGGSYLCHRSYCFRYRNSARSSNTPGSTTGNIGFRVVRDL